MIKRTIVLLLVFIFVGAFVAFAETADQGSGGETKAYLLYPNSMGLKAGVFTPSGIVYSYQFGELGWLIYVGTDVYSGFIGHSSSNNSNFAFSLNMAVGTQFNFILSDFGEVGKFSGNWYLLVGGEYAVSFATGIENIHGGTVFAGGGVELIVGDHFSFPIELGYGVMLNGTPSHKFLNNFGGDVLFTTGVLFSW